VDYKIIQTDVLVIGAGVAGNVAAFAASEQGSNVTLLSTGPSATAISSLSGVIL
jgi:succinate dehydrogenase/fumarate reductase flavoprotein subunit